METYTLTTARASFTFPLDASKRTINRNFRAADESHLWPINGRFSATEIAIRRLRRFQAESGIALEGYEYILALENEISNIVNREV